MGRWKKQNESEVEYAKKLTLFYDSRFNRNDAADTALKGKGMDGQIKEVNGKLSMK